MKKLLAALFAMTFAAGVFAADAAPAPAPTDKPAAEAKKPAKSTKKKAHNKKAAPTTTDEAAKAEPAKK